MGEAVFAGRPFRLDPHKVSWSFSIKASDLPTVGGKVIQIYGTKMNDMTVEGSFGVGGWREQEQFLKDIKEIADKQVREAGKYRNEANAQRFVYPPKEWDFAVYLKSYTNPAGGRSIIHANDIINPQWQLTFMVVEDNTDITESYGDIFLSRLAKGIGWKQTGFNGPMGMAELQEATGGMSYTEYLQAQYGVGDTPTGNQP